jgi:hypothetical protein
MTGLSFMAANLGSLEIMGMVANGAKYGMLTNHFYWVSNPGQAEHQFRSKPNTHSNRS